MTLHRFRSFDEIFTIIVQEKKKCAFFQSILFLNLHDAMLNSSFFTNCELFIDGIIKYLDITDFFRYKEILLKFSLYNYCWHYIVDTKGIS